MVERAVHSVDGTSVTTHPQSLRPATDVHPPASRFGNFDTNAAVWLRGAKVNLNLSGKVGLDATYNVNGAVNEPTTISR